MKSPAVLLFACCQLLGCATTELPLTDLYQDQHEFAARREAQTRVFRGTTYDTVFDQVIHATLDLQCTVTEGNRTLGFVTVSGRHGLLAPPNPFQKGIPFVTCAGDNVLITLRPLDDGGIVVRASIPEPDRQRTFFALLRRGLASVAARDKP